MCGCSVRFNVQTLPLKNISNNFKEITEYFFCFIKINTSTLPCHTKNELKNKCIYMKKLTDHVLKCKKINLIINEVNV